MSNNTIIIECSDGVLKPIATLLDQMKYMGVLGCSREIEIKWGSGRDVSVFFDGDGNNKIVKITINGHNEETWRKQLNIKL